MSTPITTVSCGPPQRIDGPLPQPPRSTLLSAVRLVEDTDAAGVERWGNGVKVYPYPTYGASVWDSNAPASAQTIKDGGGVIGLPEFAAFIVYLGETCSAQGVYGANMTAGEVQNRFVGRARTTLAAVEAAAVEQEFMGGAVLGNNPHLADGNGTFPNGDTPTTVLDAFAFLEDEIAASGEAGIIHCTPGTAIAAANSRIIDWYPGDNVLRTPLGTAVVPGYGYAQAAASPDGHAAASGSEAWLYATGMIEVRRTEVMLTPPEFSQAFDRANNVLTYYVERLYIVDWDVSVQAAVLADRCLQECGA